MAIKFIKSSPCFNHVRVKKFIDFFNNKNVSMEFYCWRRNKSESSPDENYLLEGGGYATKKLALYYPAWVISVLVYFSFKNIKKDKFFVIDFESALPIFILSFIKKDIEYIYDIHDDFSMRYNFPTFVNKIISSIDQMIKSRALKVIHVDENRVNRSDTNYVVIHNTPQDFFEKKEVIYKEFNSNQLIFAVTGLLSDGRGLNSIYTLAIKYPNFKFIVAGGLNSDLSRAFITLSNVEYLGVIPQKELFSKISVCHYIFSLYDPTVVINVNAASNKLYDAMMLAKPVIVNNGLKAADFVSINEIGIIIDYQFNESWDKLFSITASKYGQLSKNARQLYLRDFNFNESVEKKLDELF